tara:strand:+ start:1454 stop:2164 length:711 start_codon:yes stop_codon:yes gene_type:complete
MMSRQLSVTSLLSRFFAIILFFSGSAQAQQNTPIMPLSKEGKTYISASIVLNEFRSVALPIAKSSEPDFTIQTKFPLTAQTYALAFTYGTYIAENFKTEIRYGTGIIDDTLDELLEININYYFNWYIGGTLPVTDYMSAYALAGVSFYDADVTRHEVLRKILPPGEQLSENAKIQTNTETLSDDLFGTKFSMSWLLGLDLKLNDSWYLAFEYGRLLRDTDTNIKVYQAGTQLRYEF